MNWSKIDEGDMKELDQATERNVCVCVCVCVRERE